MPHNFSLNVGVFVDPPYVEPKYNSVKVSDSASLRIIKSGIDFELFNKIFGWILNASLIYTEATSYDEYYRMLSEGQVDILLTRESYFFDSVFSQDNITISPLLNAGGVAVFYKIHYHREPVLLLGQFDSYAIGVIILVISLVYCLDFIALKHCNVRKVFLSVLWFIFISILLGLFSNCIAVDLATSAMRATDPFKDLNDLADKWISGQCEALTLSGDRIGRITDYVKTKRNGGKALIRKLGRAQVVMPARRLKTRTKIIEEIFHSNSCKFTLDYKEIAAYYLTNYKGIGSMEMADELIATPDVYLINKNTIPIELREQIDQVFTDSVKALPEKIAKIYFRTTLSVAQTENKDDMFTIDVYKIVDPFKILIIGLSFAVLVMLFEKCSNSKL